jgi:stage II sporulation protein M
MLNKKYIFFSALIFFCFFVLGILFVNLYPSLAEESLLQLEESFSFLFEFGPLEMGVFIFLNNTLKVFLFMMLGIFLALPTLFFLGVNGWVLGFVVAISYPFLGLKGLFYSLFIHGLFEFTALFIGAGMGLRLGILVYQKHSPEKIKKEVFASSLVFLKIVIPLLFVAALLETLLIYYIK